MKHHCPNCQRALYTRRLPKCGFCGALIPEELRFTGAETDALEKKTAELEASRKQSQLAQEATPIDQPSTIIPINIP